MGCDESGYTFSYGLTGIRAHILLSEHNIAELDGIIVGGGGAAAVYAYIASEGAAPAVGLSAPIAGAIGGAILIYWGWILYEDANNGDCGVVVNLNSVLDTPSVTVTSQ